MQTLKKMLVALAKQETERCRLYLRFIISTTDRRVTDKGGPQVCRIPVRAGRIVKPFCRICGTHLQVSHRLEFVSKCQLPKALSGVGNDFSLGGRF